MSEIGVLLPVRLETRVDEVHGQWRLRLRVCPDEASILRHRESVSSAEWELLQRFWKYFSGPDAVDASLAAWLETDEGKAAWREFATALAPARACTLATDHRPLRLDADGHGLLPPNPPAGGNIQHNRVNGFPDALEVWAKFQGQAEAVRLITQPVHAAGLLLETPELELDPEDKPDPAHPERPQQKRLKSSWLNSWAAAKDVGLGMECPLKGTPQTLESLYVVGLSNARPADHFQSRVAAGDLAVLSCGLPTNTVHGTPAISLDLDAETWRNILVNRLQRTVPTLARRVSKALTGKDTALTTIPGDDPHPGGLSDDQLGQSLVKALWSPLWGHALRDFWGLKGAAEKFGMWAGRNVYPEGPLPPIRLADQPYGLLPTTSLRRWLPSTADPDTDTIENVLARLLVILRDDWARAARDGGNVVGGNTQRLLDLMARDGVAQTYGTRQGMDIGALMRTVTVPPDDGIERAFADFERETFDAFRALRDEFGIQQVHLLTTHSDVFRTSEMPLVVPTQELRLPLHQIVENMLEQPPTNTTYDRWLAKILNENQELPKPPDSLLLRLMIWGVWFNQAALILQLHPDRLLPPGFRPDLLADGLLVEPPLMTDRDGFNEDISEYERLVLKLGAAGATPTGTAGDILRIMIAGFKGIIQCLERAAVDSQEFSRIERVFRATLDSAMSRIDPFVTGLAWSRLQQLQQTGVPQRLGIYGWVDGWAGGVELGTPGPSPNNLLHTPSRGQAITSIILRDKFLFEQQDSNARNPWEMNIESQPVRLAIELAEEVQLGCHLWEAVGRRIEHIFDDRATIETLRTKFPGRPDRPDTHAVCQGMQALDELIPGNAVIPFQPNSPPDVLLQTLRGTLDVYGDLLVSEAVYQVVQGKADAAGAAMDAAVGLQRPPTLDFVKTPRQGRSVHTVVLAVLPQQSLPADSDIDFNTSPGSLADPSVAAALVEMFGAPAGWVWEIPGSPDQMTLADLQLSPVDALSLGSDTFDRIFSAKFPKADVRQLQGTGPDNHRRAREFVATIGKRLCLWRDLATEKAANDLDVQRDDKGIFENLLHRLRLLKKAGEKLSDELHSSAVANDATIAERRQLLRRAARWGIIPQDPEIGPTKTLEIVFAAAPADIDSLKLTQLMEKAAEALTNRLLAIPADLTNLIDNPPAIPDQQRANSADVSAAIISLASTGGGVVVLSNMDRGKLAAVTGLRLKVENVDLQLDWLSVIAAVRPPMARFEAWMLENEQTALPARSNDADPWLKSIIQENVVKKLQRPVSPRYVAAFGPTETWNPTTNQVAVAIIDAWNETVPTEQHATCAAFHFNAPASRPPQAILLAVPPDANQPLDSETLRDIVIETRDLAHARAASSQQLSAWRGIVPLSALPDTGSTAFQIG